MLSPGSGPRRVYPSFLPMTWPERLWNRERRASRRSSKPLDLGFFGRMGPWTAISLRRTVFLDPALRHQLEEILHPLIHILRNDWMRRETDRGSTLIVAEIPLLFEAGLEGEFDVVVFVDAPM